MKYIKIRTETQDYKWISSDSESEKKFSNFDNLMYDADRCFCVEIDKKTGSWKALFQPIKTHLKDTQTRVIQMYIQGSGNIGDEDSKFFYKLIRYCLSDTSKDFQAKTSDLTDLLSKKFTKEYVEEIYNNTTNKKCQDEISKKLDESFATIFATIQYEVPCVSSLELESKICVVDSSKPKNINLILKNLNCLINEEIIPSEIDKIVMCYTNLPVSICDRDKLYDLYSENVCSFVILTEDKTSSAIQTEAKCFKKKVLKKESVGLITIIMFLIGLLILSLVCFLPLNKLQKKNNNSFIIATSTSIIGDNSNDIVYKIKSRSKEEIWSDIINLKKQRQEEIVLFNKKMDNINIEENKLFEELKETIKIDNEQAK